MARNANTLRIAVFALCGLSFGIWALGCSSNSTSDQGVGSQSQNLARATVTLSAPNPLSPIAPVLLSSNSITLGAGANIVSGTVAAMGNGVIGLNAGSAAVVANDAWSRAFALLGSSVQVRGTLHAAQVSQGPGVVLGKLDSTPPFDPPSTLRWDVTYPPGLATNVTLSAGQTKSLVPGLYGTVTVNGGANLTLATGTYFLTSLTLAQQSTVSLDQSRGPIIIYVTGTLKPDGVFTSLLGAAPDLFVGYLGSSGVVLGNSGAPFNGAVAAPFSTITFVAVKGVHTGFFAAVDITLAAGAQVQYRTPTALVAAANPPGTTCSQLLAGVIPIAALSRYCKVCTSPDDTDHDRVPDCLDGCPYDPKKTAPGACGCGVSDTDSDGDGVPDCLDKCSLDRNNTSPGQCGCQGQANLAPAGTPCTDTACPQSGAVCDGAGVCGNRSACNPGGPGACYYANFDEVSYWICGDPPKAVGLGDAGAPPGQLTRNAAEAACSNKGLTLTRINSLTRNRLIQKLISTPLWLGANDISVQSAWRWARPGTNDGDQFWAGGSSGVPVQSRFAYWSDGAPAMDLCAAMNPTAGTWRDVGCGESLGYICAFDTPVVKLRARPPPYGGAQPPHALRPCVPSDAAAALLPLPSDDAGLDKLKNDRAAAKAGHFQGAAANPPPDGSVCPSDFDTDASGVGLNPSDGGGCAIVATAPNSVDCRQDSDCTPGFVCRQVKDNPDCNPPDSGPGIPTDADTCKGRSFCVQLSCPPDPRPSCDQIEICDPGTEFDAGLDPGSHLDAQVFNPASLFGGSVPDAAPSPAYNDPPDGSGILHTWCFLGPQNPTSVTPAHAPGGQKGGTSGGQSVISFGFNPNLIFDVDPHPLALGETDLKLNAQASLDATVALHHFLGQDYTASIVHAEAALHASRCNVNDNGTQLTVFGLDLVPLSALGVPEFDTATDFKQLTQQCNQALGTFQLYADRVKKAFRDAQQLLVQYHAAKAGGGNLQSDLCQQIGVLSADVPFFPGGNACPLNEPVEITINRFIDYYQAPGSGQTSLLKNVTSNLHTASSALSQIFSEPEKLAKDLSQKYSLQFADLDQEESQTIIDAPFAIGPIPMLLQVDVFASYGINGNFGAELDFTSFGLAFEGTPPAKPQPLAQVTLAVLPHASAGLSAFVGAGFDFGPIGASVGIEGDLTLAEVQAPLFAGAGVNVQVTDDLRPPPVGSIQNVAPPISEAASNVLGSALQFGLPKSFKFDVWYNYGLGVDLQNVLSGEVDATLRIDFFFFSRTWRARVVKFNGWSEHFDLISGGGDLSVATSSKTVSPPPRTPPDEAGTTSVAEGTAAMGLSEQQVPLTKLARLPIPVPDFGTSDAGGGSVVPADLSAVQHFFYDNQCCARNQEFCIPPGAAPDPSNPAAYRAPCCPGFNCALSTGPLSFFSCQPVCVVQDQNCKTNTDCCPGLICGTISTCVPPPPCVNLGQSCRSAAECCDGAGCTAGVCCENLHQACNASGDCCGGATCSAGACCRDTNQSCSMNADCCGSLVCQGGACIPRPPP